MREKDKAIWSKAREYLDVRNNDEHTIYSYYLGMQLLKHEPEGDPDIVLPAILLHDTGWKKIPKNKILHAFGPDKKYPELQRQHELESVIIAKDVLRNLEYSEEDIQAITAIIDGHDTDLTERSINDGLMKDADKLWRYTAHGIRIISGWFGIEQEAFYKILEDYVHPRILRPSSLLVANALLTVAKTHGSVEDHVNKKVEIGN